jgi:hypothetical protein
MGHIQVPRKSDAQMTYHGKRDMNRNTTAMSAKITSQNRRLFLLNISQTSQSVIAGTSTGFDLPMGDLRAIALFDERE